MVLLRWVDAPPVDASDAEITAYYGDLDGHSGLATLQILVWGTIGFLWFIGVLRDKIGPDEPKLFGTVFLGGGILLAALMFVGSALFAAPLVLVEESGRAIDPDAVAMTRTLGRIVLGVIAPRIASVFIFSLSGLAIRTGAMPKWFVVVSYATGIVMFQNITFTSPSVFLFPAWMLFASTVLLVRGRDSN